MSITIEQVKRRYYIVGSPKSQAAACRSAGCNWDTERNQWWTGKRDTAEKLADELNAELEAQKGARAAEIDRLTAVGAPKSARVMRARFESWCAGTKQQILYGDEIAYADGKAWLLSRTASNQAEIERRAQREAERKARAAAQAEAQRLESAQRIEQIRATGKDPVTGYSVAHAADADAQTLELLDGRGMREMASRFAGVCDLTGAPIKIGTRILWSREVGTRLAEPGEVRLPRASIGIGDYSYDSPPFVGQRRRDRDGSYYIVTDVVSRRIREDGMSFGFAFDSGTEYTLWGRELTDEEQHELALDVAATDKRRIATEELAALRTEIAERGTRPPAAEGQAVIEDGVECFEEHGANRIYGGGRWLVVTPTQVWAITNNGADGDSWANNNVRTGGAGALGAYVERTAELDARLHQIAHGFGQVLEFPERVIEPTLAGSSEPDEEGFADDVSGPAPDLATLKGEAALRAMLEALIGTKNCVEWGRALGVPSRALERVASWLQTVGLLGSVPAAYIVEWPTPQAAPDVREVVLAARDTLRRRLDVRQDMPWREVRAELTRTRKAHERWLVGIADTEVSGLVEQTTPTLNALGMRTLPGVSLVERGGQLVVEHPYSRRLVEAWKTRGGSWDGARWHLDPSWRAEVETLLDEHYGHHGQPVLVCTLEWELDFDARRAQTLWLAGREIAKRPQRDWSVKFGEGVDFVRGAIPLKGGSRKSPSIDADPGTVLRIRDVPVGLAQRMLTKHKGMRIAGLDDFEPRTTEQKRLAQDGSPEAMIALYREAVREGAV